MLQNTAGPNATGILNTINVDQYPSGWLCGWPYYYGYPVYQDSSARPIKLTLIEVECLRKAAKADEKIKAILTKFTDQIEVTVEFG